MFRRKVPNLPLALVAGLAVLVCLGSLRAQSPFDGKQIDTTLSKKEAGSAGTITATGMRLTYQLQGLKNIKSLSFQNLAAWNFPNEANLEADLAADKIAVSGSMIIESGGDAARDEADHLYRIQYWYVYPDLKQKKVVVIEKKARRPFSENFSFQIPVIEGIGSVSFQVIFMEDAGPSQPYFAHVSLILKANAAAVPAPPPWKGVIGKGAAGLAAVAAAAAALAVALRTRKKQKNAEPAPQKNESGETAGYVLQVSDNNVTLAPNQHAPLVVTAWRVGSDGSYHAAPEAAIAITPSAPQSCLDIVPRNGSGTLSTTLLFARPASCRNEMLTISANARGSAFSTEVRVALEQYDIEFF